MDWYKNFTSAHDDKFPWIVKFTHKDGHQEEIQISGESAQDCADYVRKVYSDVEIIDFIAKINNNWE